MNVELSDRAHQEMQRINAVWRKQADFPELFLDELLETVKLIETTGVLGTSYQVRAKYFQMSRSQQLCDTAGIGGGRSWHRSAPGLSGLAAAAIG